MKVLWRMAFMAILAVPAIAQAGVVRLDQLEGYYHTDINPSTTMYDWLNVVGQYAQIEDVRMRVVLQAYDNETYTGGATMMGRIGHPEYNNVYTEKHFYSGEVCDEIMPPFWHFGVKTEPVEDWLFLLDAPRQVTLSIERWYPDPNYHACEVSLVEILIDGVVIAEKTSWGFIKSLYVRGR